MTSVNKDKDLIESENSEMATYRLPDIVERQQNNQTKNLA